MMTGEQENGSIAEQESENGPGEIAINFAGEDAPSEEDQAPQTESSTSDERSDESQSLASEAEEDAEADDTDDDVYVIDASELDDSLDPPDAGKTVAKEPSNGVTSAIEEHGGLAIADFQNQIDALTRDKNLLYDQLLRRQAEFENYRKRTERDRAETYNRARADIITELLPVIDNFDRALSSLETSSEDAAGLRHGIELIHKQFKDILTKLGLEPVEAVGRPFDPHVHEAVATELTGEHEDNTIIAEFERGYKLGDKLLRPAKVKVASTPED
ncbi:MAG: nucleotide exchange factor GrpE [Acidobacteriota bacterium]